MQITLNIKPIKYTARTKEELLSKIRSGCVYVAGGTRATSYNAYRRGRGDGDFVLYNLVKFRHKSKDTNKGRERVRDAHWDAYVYVVPARLVKSAKQGPRNFRLVVG